MKILKNKHGKEVKIFAETIEDSALSQVKKLMNSNEYSTNNMCFMPDIHMGKDCVIGTVMKLKDKITPSLVGVDIGCGMLTIKLTRVNEIDFDILDKIIRKYVPTGQNIRTAKTDSLTKQLIVIFEDMLKDDANISLDALKCVDHINKERALLSIGTLGGGNHFIEVAKSDNDGSLYLVIHTGSRFLGKQVYSYYQNKAFFNRVDKDKQKELIEKLKSENRHSEISSELDKLRKETPLAEFPFLNKKDHEDYLHDIDIVQKYAKVNRLEIARVILSMLFYHNQPSCFFDDNEVIETIHNYIDVEENILRKGSVSAKKDEMLLIPINMRDGSLLCKGKGSKEWLCSAPHGGGRILSRRKAFDTLSLEKYKNDMKDIHSTTVCAKTLDEAPSAYKDMNEIISCIEDTVEIVDILKPVYNFKNDQ